MAHFCRVDEFSVVRDVQAVKNEAIENLPFPASEPVGQALLAESGFVGHWLQCSYNATFRGAYPASGWSYDEALDVFVPPGVKE